MADIFQAEFEKVEELNESPQRIMAIQEAARRRIKVDPIIKTARGLN